MKPGARAAGIAESFDGERSTLAAAVVRVDRVVDGLAFGTCAVGGNDATERVGDLLDALAREDLHAVLVSGIAPAWYNVLDLHEIAERADRPVVSVSFETSEGLGPALRREFDGDALADRLERYRRQPERERLRVNDESVWVRAVGAGHDEAREVVRAFTPEGGRPEPLRVARLAARAGDRLRTD